MFKNLKSVIVVMPNTSRSIEFVIIYVPTDKSIVFEIIVFTLNVFAIDFFSFSPCDYFVWK